MNELKRTQLYQWHVDHGGRMVPFAGWEMPVQYPTGPIEEHHITRRSAGLFDIDHMGQVAVTGPEAWQYLDHLLTNDMGALVENQAAYALMCREDGGIVDDVFVYKLPEQWLVVINADNREKDVEWMAQHMTNYDVSLQDVSDETYMIALQGPKAIDIIQRLATIDLLEFRRFTAVETELNGLMTIIGRTGYTGEDGVELFFPAQYALETWEAILHTAETAGIEIAPIGLAARDSLRFEPSFSLYGHEINDETTPLESDLEWACKFDTEFIGKAALLKQKEQGLTKNLIAFELTQKGVPRQGYPVASADGQVIGKVVTGLYAPTVEKYCGHAFVPLAYAEIGTEINIVIRDKPKSAVVIKRPLYTPAYKK
jgi:glycine cleavage system T protein